MKYKVLNHKHYGKNNPNNKRQIWYLLVDVSNVYSNRTCIDNTLYSKNSTPIGWTWYEV